MSAKRMHFTHMVPSYYGGTDRNTACGKDNSMGKVEATLVRRNVTCKACIKAMRLIPLPPKKK